MYILGAAAKDTMGLIANNKITITNGGGTVYGLYTSSATGNYTINNVISVATTGTTAYGLYISSGGGNQVLNNTVVSNATGTTTSNTAVYIATSSGNMLNLQNNIFSAPGGGYAMGLSNASFVYSDYNMYWTSGTNLLRLVSTNYTTLQAWRDGVFWDFNSIVYQPALISNTDLRPNLASPEVWAMHGRGVQIPGNSYDFYDSIRPTTLTTGVPDLSLIHI